MHEVKKAAKTYSSDESSDKRPTPDSDRFVLLAPFSGVVTQHDLKREVDQNRQSEIFLAESLVQEFEIGDGIIGLETNLGDQMNDDESLDILQFEDSTHRLVDVPDAFLFFREVLLFEDCEADGDKNVHPAPEGEVGVQCH